MTADEKSDPSAVAVPRYWVPEKEVAERLDIKRKAPHNCLPSRAEPSRAEPSRAEPSRAEPSRAEPSRAEPSRAVAEPSSSRAELEPSRAELEPSRAEPSRAEPSRAEPSFEPSRAEPSRAEPSRIRRAQRTWLAARLSEISPGHIGRADRSLLSDSPRRSWSYDYNFDLWFFAFRNITAAQQIDGRLSFPFYLDAIRHELTVTPVIRQRLRKGLSRHFETITNSTNDTDIDRR